MTALSVMVYISVSWLILWSIKNMRQTTRDHQPLPPWEEDRIRRLRQREIDESKRIGWRRG